MKQKIFTLMILLALVVAGGKAFGQNSKMSPTVNSTWDYNANNLTVGATVGFFINNSGTDWTAAATGGTVNSQTAVTVPAGGLVSANVTWGSSTGTYYLWVQLTASSCSNYRCVQVDVVANTFDVVLYAIGADRAELYDDADWTTATDDAADCPDFVSTTYDFDVTAGASSDDGETYVFFRVNRTGGNSSSTWVFDFSETTDHATAIAYYDGSWHTGYVEGTNLTIASTVNNVLVRLTITNAPAGYNVTGVVADLLETVGSKPDLTAANNTKTIAISAMPNMSTVTFD